MVTTPLRSGADGDMVAAAKALADMARDSKILAVRGGVLQGRTMTAAEVENLATLPPADVLRGQVLAAIIAPLTAIAGLVNAPLQNLYGLIDARIEQLGGPDAAPAAPEEPQAEADESTPADATASASDQNPEKSPEKASPEKEETS